MDSKTTVGFMYDEDGFITEPKYVEDNTAVYRTVFSELEEVCLPVNVKLVECSYSQKIAEAVLDKCREALEMKGITACGFLTTSEGLLVLSSDRETVYPMKQGVFQVTEEFPVDTYESEEEEYEYLKEEYEYAKYAKYSS